MAASAGDKSILIRGYRAEDLGDWTEALFIVKPTTNGSTQVDEINLTASETRYYFAKSSFALIGSTLYAVGGQFSNAGLDDSDLDSDLIFRLDTENPILGWRSCASLPFHCPLSTVAVSGNFIYLFPRESGPQISWGCVYNTTSTERCRMIKPPPAWSDGKLSRDPPFCAAFDFYDGTESCGFLVSKSEGGHIYLYNTDQDSWENCCDYKFPNSSSASLPQRAVLNGKLYLSYCNKNCNEPTILCAYEILTGKLIGKFEVPKFIELNPESDSELILVAIADYSLCYMWLRNKVPYECNKTTLFVAKVVVDPNSGDVTTHSMEELVLNAQDIMNFIPLARMEQIIPMDEKLWLPRTKKFKLDLDQAYWAKEKEELEDLWEEVEDLRAKMKKKVQGVESEDDKLSSLEVAGLEQIKVDEDVEMYDIPMDEKLWLQQTGKIKMDRAYRAEKKKELDDLRAKMKKKVEDVESEYDNCAP